MSEKPVAECSVDGCKGKVHCRGLCDKHYTRLKRHGDISINLHGGGKCSIEGCNNNIRCKGLCSIHYDRLRHNGTTERINSEYGKGHVTPYGYKMLFSGNGIGPRLKFEHRIIAEKLLGRLLTANEVVHHKNGNKLDNRFENLEVMERGEHLNLHRKLNKLIESGCMG